jgi:hypothetical protein
VYDERRKKKRETTGAAGPAEVLKDSYIESLFYVGKFHAVPAILNIITDGNGSNMSPEGEQS